ncbi:DUF6089 family protein [Tenacibaculum sp. UWU-22]|uniref:type IX secretion system protein PorG n=1 Tax=Tenacibaculum sp. UWU-22 TaxID=3234187 RepID=UPI0034DAC740
MKNVFFYILFILVTNSTFSQIHEIGLFIGGCNYVGDIGRTNYIYPENFSGAFMYKYNYTPRIGFRATYTYLPIKADDANASNPYRKQQGRSFKNTINEFALGMEYNFFEYNISKHSKSFTPYILIEAATFNYKSPVAISSNNTITLQQKYSYAIPFGLGIKGRLGSSNLAFAFETKVRYTFVDDLDYSTARFPENPILHFGGQGNDWYMFTGISLIYTFGRPPCYTDAP